MILENFISEPTAQLLWLVLTILLFAGLGAIYALSGKAKNADENFDWSKGKYPVAAMSATGAIAGVITLLTTGEFDIVVFGAALGTVGILLDQLREMFQTGADRYNELQDEEVSQSEALLISLRHAIEQGDIEALRAAIGNYTDEHGEPSMETARETSEELRDNYEEGGIRRIYDEDLGHTVPVDPARDADVTDSKDTDTERKQHPSPPREHDTDTPESDDEQPPTNDGETVITEGA